MAATYTASGRFILQGSGDNLNIWGAILNSQALALIDTMIAGVTSVTITGDTVLTSLNGAADQSRAAFLKLTGAPAANFTVTIPSVPKLYRVSNATGKIATFTAGGATVQIDSGDTIDIQCDGTDVTTPGVGGVSWKAYISSVVAGGPYGNVPSVVGQAGKFLGTNGAIPIWLAPASTDLSDYSTRILGVQVALAVAL